MAKKKEKYKDDREPLWKKQRKERGFDDPDLWNLFVTIAEFILPRLIVFRKELSGYPGRIDYDKKGKLNKGRRDNKYNKKGEQEWYRVLGKMIYAFRQIAKDEVEGNLEKQRIKEKKVEEGLDLFREYFYELWS